VVFTFATKTSTLPALAVCTAPVVVGKFVDSVNPAMYAAPEPSTAMLWPESVLVPPRYVAYAKAEPAAFSFATKESLFAAYVVCAAPVVVGKSVELVYPVTYAAPAASTTMPYPSSALVPPR
jgi:hypothetical protein